MTDQTHYEILGVKENATLEEIKSAYRKMVLILHPDKKVSRKDKNLLGTPNTTQITDEENFNLIQLAWECLRDEQLRYNYNDELQRKREKQNLIYNKATLVHLHEMHREEVDCENDLGYIETQYIFSYKCRCGDTFEIFEDEISADGNSVFECQSCTLAINICRDDTKCK
jgi:diphthamide biosynthesis protein 4